MNLSRFKSIMDGQTRVAQKVYECVPILEPWSADAIYGEYKRNGAIDYRTLVGCLRTLVEAGVVKENPTGIFCRVQVKPDSQPKPKKEPVVTTQFDALANLASRLAKLSEEAKAIATELENTALTIAQERANNEEAAAKLETLRALLKGV